MPAKLTKNLSWERVILIMHISEVKNETLRVVKLFKISFKSVFVGKIENNFKKTFRVILTFENF